MTAFKEVMTAEQEADQALAAAKQEATAAVAAAETDRQNRLAQNEAVLKEAEQSELIKHKQQLDSVLKKISNETESQVEAVKKRFALHKAELVSLLKQRFQ